MQTASRSAPVSVAAAMMRSATGKPCAKSSKSKTNAAGVWNGMGPDGVGATWGFEVEPARDGVLIGQWAGPGPSGLTPAVLAQPDKEARIVVRRLSEWQQNMHANLDWIRAH